MYTDRIALSPPRRFPHQLSLNAFLLHHQLFDACKVYLDKEDITDIDTLLLAFNTTDLDAELQSVGMMLGPRIKLQHAIKQLNQSDHTEALYSFLHTNSLTECYPSLRDADLDLDTLLYVYQYQYLMFDGILEQLPIPPHLKFLLISAFKDTRNQLVRFR